jgi:hypothetical protein
VRARGCAGGQTAAPRWPRQRRPSRASPRAAGRRPPSAAAPRETSSWWLRAEGGRGGVGWARRGAACGSVGAQGGCRQRVQAAGARGCYGTRTDSRAHLSWRLPERH